MASLACTRIVSPTAAVTRATLTSSGPGRCRRAPARPPAAGHGDLDCSVRAGDAHVAMTVGRAHATTPGASTPGCSKNTCTSSHSTWYAVTCISFTMRGSADLVTRRWSTAGQAAMAPPSPPDQRDREQAELARCEQARQNAGAVAVSRDAERDIGGRGQVAQLMREDRGHAAAGRRCRSRWPRRTSARWRAARACRR